MIANQKQGQRSWGSSGCVRVGTRLSSISFFFFFFYFSVFFVFFLFSGWDAALLHFILFFLPLCLLRFFLLLLGLWFSFSVVLFGLSTYPFFVCLFFCFSLGISSVYLSIGLFPCLFFCLSVSLHISIYVFIYLYVLLFLRIVHVFLSVYT